MGSHPFQDHFQPDFARAFDEQFLKKNLDIYFRPEYHGFEKLPKRGPFVLAANHSGNAFPYDATMLDIGLWRYNNYDPDLKVRSTAERALSSHWWCRPYGIDDFWRRCGCVDMTFENFESLLAGGYRTAYYPEGARGIGKGFDQRYQLQRFSSSFVTLAARYEVPVYPVYVINAEWSVPFTYTFPWVNKLTSRFLGLPFVPIPAVFSGILFPWVWYISCPVKLVYVVGDPIDMRALLARAGETDPQRPDIEIARRVAQGIREEMQETLHKLVAVHGSKPFNLKDLFARLKKHGRRFLAVSPLAWPFGFIRFHRDFVGSPAPNRWRALLRDWDILLYYLPFAWPLLSLVRALRKPPYGYRGLSRSERLERMGEYIWRFRGTSRFPKRGVGAPENRAQDKPGARAIA